MAARLSRSHSNEVRQKIQTSYFITRLTEHVKGNVDLSKTQITAIKILLDKSLPNLSDVKIETGGKGITFNLNANLPSKD